MVLKKLLTSDLVKKLRDFCPAKGGGFYVKYYILSQILANPDFLEKNTKHLKKSINMKSSAIREALDFLSENGITTPDDVRNFADTLEDDTTEDKRISITTTPPTEPTFSLSYEELEYFKREVYNFDTVFILAKRLKQYNPPCDDFELICRVAKFTEDENFPIFEDLKNNILN